ncbi:cyclic nucleotide-binding domain-containing protein [Toxoplasma gondii TgCatPRC2]|uniref:Cyclic nucleotide-binding domain-containing protein n=13 Tax=Toxoplasma gondii TaxID=5811 RepID=A0A125YWH9_TOXGV|nr:cyclic nucleotide-binding domain-containing protein [Toxoplasma gondii ME49]EPR61497.1 cyclic nucleotide-binding domain-containing protein [Toxoplasma gondii GT1]ESS33139.1 cyclic nucleotide-binding domain-containing protein [Toxoplasma gondii VEG]KFG27604.1 cyclic nucleotide-binding domain-containing protein [Toxoplasma gondii p89]KFG38139.1 cyclic nucleotide-binding domain-containing protein [Toxoplasma gondii GAB2-2007-GAL-DOM2]KFG39718.1 cyclic nucleotide-binding domain-containing prote|eukprot:XP_018637304.1 cyclic nucleotide-binding domain-containing protein [Toxoplasma gondii ME49]
MMWKVQLLCTRCHVRRCPFTLSSCMQDPKDRTADDIDGMFQVISNVNLFSKLDEATQKSLCRSLTYEAYAAKQVVFRYGDWGDKYYIILSGRVSVQAPLTPTSETFQQVAILESGGGFGEMALMENKPRAATVVCLETTGTLASISCRAYRS